MRSPVLKNPVKNTVAMKNGAYLELGILVARLYNLGESASSISSVIRSALQKAEKDGVGQEA